MPTMANNPSYYIKGKGGVHLIALIYPTAHYILCLFVEIEWLLQACFVTLTTAHTLRTLITFLVVNLQIRITYVLGTFFLLML